MVCPFYLANADITGETRCMLIVEFCYKGQLLSDPFIYWIRIPIYFLHIKTVNEYRSISIQFVLLKILNVDVYGRVNPNEAFQTFQYRIFGVTDTKNKINIPLKHLII